MHNGQKNYPKNCLVLNIFTIKAAVVLNFCLIGKIQYNFQVLRMIEPGRQAFMPIQSLDLLTQSAPFGRSVNPIPIRGAEYAHHITSAPPSGFLDLPPPLRNIALAYPVQSHCTTAICTVYIHSGLILTKKPNVFSTDPF